MAPAGASRTAAPALGGGHSATSRSSVGRHGAPSSFVEYAHLRADGARRSRASTARRMPASAVTLSSGRPCGSRRPLGRGAVGGGGEQGGGRRERPSQAGGRKTARWNEPRTADLDRLRPSDAGAAASLPTAPAKGRRRSYTRAPMLSRAAPARAAPRSPPYCSAPQARGEPAPRPWASSLSTPSEEWILPTTRSPPALPLSPSPTRTRERAGKLLLGADRLLVEARTSGGQEASLRRGHDART